MSVSSAYNGDAEGARAIHMLKSVESIIKGLVSHTHTHTHTHTRSEQSQSNLDKIMFTEM